MRLARKDRFEIKYLISFQQKQEIVDTLMRFAELDKNSPEHGYNVFSIYYDTHNFRFYREKIEGLEKRVKFRIRSYKKSKDDDPNGLFLEIKAKDNFTIIKDRCFLPHDICSRLISDNIDVESLSDFADHYVVKKFIYYHKRWHIKPVAAIQYKRLPLMLKHYHNFRITFDHSIKCMDTGMLNVDFSNAEYCLPSRLVVLEVKFNDKMPLWLMNYIKHHNLTQRRVSKYALAIEHLYQKRLQRRIMA